MAGSRVPLRCERECYAAIETVGCLMGLIDFCDEEVMGRRLADNHNCVLYYSDEMPCYLTFVLSLLFV
jgi:hypothetical protein